MSKVFIANCLVLLIVLVIVAVFLIIINKKKNKSHNSEPGEEAISKPENKKQKPDYEVDSVQNFLDFEKIAKNMIVREKGSRFTMVIHCSGINFDLLSGNEKMMVEESFIEFLNFIRYPVQIYVQTRKVDLKDSLKTYGTKISRIEDEIKELINQYDTVKGQDYDNASELEMLEFEIRRKQNLLDYAVDLKENIELMSINSNVLQHKYYIAVTYRLEELGLMINFSEDEIIEMVFAELYTRCHGIMSTLSGCDIKTKVLDSNELAELLYMAFNRDDAELCRLRDVMDAGFYRLYSTTEDSLELGYNELQDFGQNQDENQLLLLTDSLELDESSLELLIETSKESA
ncbi:MAG: hypothetical protein ACM3KR_08270 [Deltaproteobacteria bacterium]